MDFKRPRENEDTAAVDAVARARPDPGDCPETPALNPYTDRPFSARYRELLRTRKQLPIYGKRDLILQTVLAHPVTILVGETGSGKTTQVPQFIGELRTCFPGVVACSQPRRIAAVSVATRVAEEMDVRLGDEVGYHVRFESVKSARTRVLYLTDGMLLREAFTDPDLGKFGVIVVDEAHERTVDTDVLLGLLKLLCARRPNFRLVVMSATLDITKIQSFFPAAPLVAVSGRMYGVDVAYAPTPVSDYVAAAVARAVEIHRTEPAGDILCFLTGEAEVERAVAATVAALRGHLAKENGSADQGPNNLRSVTERDSNNHSGTAPPASAGSTETPRLAVVLPLFGSLSLAEQQKVFQSYPSTTRKMVFSTNIAETSVTIDGVVYVVDSGYQKQSLYSSQARVDYLLPAVISKASAEQRKGRAGRTRPGKCFRLFTEADFGSFPDQNPPDILRTNALNTVLLLLKLGVSNVLAFPFLDMPSEEALGDAFYQLTYFEAVDDELQISEFGRKMADFPVNACLARMLLKSAGRRCSADAAVMAAMLEAGNVFVRPPSRRQEADQAHQALAHPDGDHVARFLLFHAYLRESGSGGGGAAQFCRKNFLRQQALQQAVQVYQQLCRLMADAGVPIYSTYNAQEHTVDSVALRKAVLDGFFTQVAHRAPLSTDDTYRTVRDGMALRLHRQSSLAASGGGPNKFARRPPVWLMYDRLEVQGADGTFARVGSPIEVEWLLEASDYYTELTEIPDREIAYALKQASESRAAGQPGPAA